MKKVILSVLIFSMLFCFAGCAQSVFNRNQLTALQKTFDTAEEQSGVDLSDDQIYIPPVINEISEGVDVTIERFDDEGLTSINFLDDSMSAETEKYKLATMGIGEFDTSEMYNGYFTIDEWLLSFDPQVFNDGERNYYIYVYDSGEENSKYFILRYIVENNTIFNVSGEILNFTGDTLTEEEAQEIYEDFKVVSLSELKQYS